MEKQPNRRPAIPESIALAVMVANRHTCCLSRNAFRNQYYSELPFRVCSGAQIQAPDFKNAMNENWA
jgi:hypothetical protein